ncbi:MAG: phosphodiester glycosidase family protein [Bacteroidota bacterium]
MRWLLLSIGLLWGCASAPPPVPSPALGLAWTAVDSLRQPGVEVWAGRSDAFPLRTWAVRLDDVPLRVLLAADTTDRRDGPTTFAQRTGACVVLNGGYFSMATGEVVGLATVDGEILSPATSEVERDNVRYPVTRGAVGIGPRGVEIEWAGEPMTRCEAPSDNRPGRPGTATSCSAWPVSEAISAGPMLLRNGRPTKSADAEAFFGTGIPQRNPRSAIGVDSDGRVWLVVVDGRQPDSRGVTLPELAALMAALGARDALNLDGGGSSAMVVRSGEALVRLNRPTGYDVEREVATALGAFCDGT